MHLQFISDEKQVHIDLVLVEDSMKKSYFVAHATDHVSRFQAAQVLEDKSTASVIKFLKTHWMPLLGRPSTLVADQGREFDLCQLNFAIGVVPLQSTCITSVLERLGKTGWRRDLVLR